MKKTLIALSVIAASAAQATPFTGNDAKSNAMGNTGVASAASFAMGQFNPALLAANVEGTRFGILLPATKFYIDDSSGLIEYGRDFYDSTFDDFETSSDAAADINVAISGESGGEASLADVTTDISANVTAIQNAVANIKADTDGGNQPDQADIDALNNNSAALTSNSTLLDNKITTINTSSTTLSTSFGNMRRDLPGFNDRPAQLGLDLGAAFAMPRSGLSFGVSLNNTTTVGTSVDVKDSDLVLFSDLLEDLEGISAEGTDASGELVTLSSNTQSLTTVIGNQPDPNDYVGGQANAQYQSDITAWGNDLEAASLAVDNQATVVDNEFDDVETYNGNYFQNGEFNEPENQDLETTVEVIGANIVEFGVSFAREFEYMGETFAAGITPKLQSITVFEDTILLANAEDEFGDDTQTYLESNTSSYFTGNLDIGVAKSWPDVLRGQVRGGLVIKDLIPQTFETESGTELSIGPKMRIGGAHMTRWTTLAADLDITENQPLKYGVPTRYLGLGAEFNAYNWFKLRGGYRNNLSVENSHVISAGFGFTPWGVGLDLTGWFKPKSFDDWDEVIQDAGMVAQFSMEF